ncbi:E3 ubiquitin-protein ligase MYCBP2-like [Diaphorina citri]|uniref:E3 ubiquitin-protein ligase MYCBP2-like n=1 Tax=Diaphorina citri TaxID=121845 RepID=A0A3Q0JGD8_DIACI|nr:E3 ubiquitin-protein ligase MYCBP2-like [Diaphorina citri]
MNKGNLYFRNSLDMNKVDLICLDKTTFNVHCVLRLPKHVAHGVMFSDFEQLGVITSGKDDGFVVRILNPTSAQSGGPLISTNELPLKLARKCLDIFGTAAWEEGGGGAPVERNAEDVMFLGCGKEFSLMLSSSGQVSYCGKSSYLGMKQNPNGPVVCTKWSELVVAKASKVTHVALGHEGLHAIILDEDGAAFFCGTSRRGEDGDSSKIRRQPKASKPKLMNKLESQIITHAACNYGTTALVNREGELFMFGKDTSFCDPNTVPSHNVPGLVTGIGPQYGRRAIWIAASADQTFIKMDESLISASSLLSSTLMANKQCIVLFPKGTKEARQFKCLVMSKKDGSCHNFNGEDQIDLVHNSVAALDPVYNVLWQYTPR